MVMNRVLFQPGPSMAGGHELTLLIAPQERQDKFVLHHSHKILHPHCNELRKHHFK
jgi:hypothetical protein